MSTKTASQGAVKITLHSANNDVDEKAEVTVALKNPEEAVAKMLKTLAQRFPPESVMTIQPHTSGLTGSSSNGTSSRHLSGSSHNASRPSHTMGKSPIRKIRGAEHESPAAATRLPSDNGSVVTNGSNASPNARLGSGRMNSAGYNYPHNAAYPSNSSHGGHKDTSKVPAWLQPAPQDRVGVTPSKFISPQTAASRAANTNNQQAQVFPGMVYPPYGFPAHPVHYGQSPHGDPMMNVVGTPWPAMMAPPMYPGFAYPGAYGSVSPPQDKSGKSTSSQNVAGGTPAWHNVYQMAGYPNQGFVPTAVSPVAQFPIVAPPAGPSVVEEDEGVTREKSRSSQAGGANAITRSASRQNREGSGTGDSWKMGNGTANYQTTNTYPAPIGYEPQASAWQTSVIPGADVSCPTNTQQLQGCYTPGGATGTHKNMASTTSAHNGMPTSALRPGFGEYVEVLPDGSRVRYVEVEVHEEREIEVPKVEVHEVVKEEKVYEYKTREVEVEDLQYEDVISYHDKITEEVREVEKKVKRREEIPVEKVVEHHVDVHTTREQIVEVPEIIEVERPYTVEQQQLVPRYHQNEVPCVIAQKLKPVLTTGADSGLPKMRIDTMTYEPVLYAVDVYIPKPVHNAIVSGGKIDETHQQVNIPAAQYNSLTYKLNPTLEKTVVNEVCLKTVEGHVPLLPAGELNDIVPPLPGAWQTAHPIYDSHRPSKPAHHSDRKKDKSSPHTSSGRRHHRKRDDNDNSSTSSDDKKHHRKRDSRKRRSHRYED